MIIIPNGLTPPEIRVLQEFRRLNTDAVSLEAIKAIRHPAGGGDAPASLVAQGWLTAAGETFTLTERAKEFLAIEALPEGEEPARASASATEADASPDA